MTPADKRILELVSRWLTSLDLHLKYAKLDDDAYWQVQPWPKHDRPNRWILELARQKVLELQAQCQTQAAKGDGKLAEALELMAFLSNLVGSQHVQRFIPIADPDKENREARTADSTVEQPRPTALRPAENANDHTREMPRPPLNQKRAVPAQAPKAQRTVAAASQAKPAAHKPMTPPSTETQQTVMADAVRLLKWGRQWHELAELIARMAERPTVTEVRRILRAKKPEIEALAAE